MRRIGVLVDIVSINMSLGDREIADIHLLVDIVSTGDAGAIAIDGEERCAR